MGGDTVKQCVMCKQEFDEAKLDFIGRCTPCFEAYKQTPDHKKPNLGIPFTPGYNSTWRKG